MKKIIGITLLTSMLVISGSLLVMAQETTTTTVAKPGLQNRIKNILGNMFRNKSPKQPGNDQNITGTSMSKPVVSKPVNSKPLVKPNATLDVACVKAAIATRDSAIISAWTTRSTKLQEAFNLRSTQLQAAWDIANAKERNDALKTV